MHTHNNRIDFSFIVAENKNFVWTLDYDISIIEHSKRSLV